MVGFDWRGWKHGPVTGPAHAAVGLSAAAAVSGLPAIGLSPEWVIGGGALGCGVVALRSAYGVMSRTGLVYRLGCVGGAAVWLAHTVTVGWSPAVGFALLAGSATAGGMSKVAAAQDGKARESRREAAAREYADSLDQEEQEHLWKLADRWLALLARQRLSNIGGCQIKAIEHWRFPGPGGEIRETGYTVEVVLPATGVTWRNIAQHEEAFASILNLPDGCGVEVRKGASRRRALIHVSTHNALADDIPLPQASSPRTVNEPLPVAVLRNGSEWGIPLRAECAVLTGETRSGKSNQLQTTIARLMECNDTIVVVIDYNGGGVALDWLSPWADGEIRKPPVFWVAGNEDEALRLCRWLLAVIEHRKRVYAAANRARNDDKVAVSPGLPEIVVVVDEVGAIREGKRGAEVLELLVQVSDRGGAAAVRAVTCGLRAVSAYVPTALLAQARVRIGMRVTASEELSYLFGWGKGASPENTPAPGYGYGAVGPVTPTVIKGYRTTPNIIRSVATTSDRWRPDLDYLTATMPGWEQVVADRWNRSAHIVAAARTPVPAGADHGGDRSGAGPGGTELPRTEPEPPGPAGTGPAGPGGPRDLDEALADLDAARKRLEDAMNGGGRPGEPVDTNAAFEEIVGRQALVPELLVRILTAMGGRERMHTVDLAAKIGARPETLGGLLSKVDVRPLPNAFELPGKGRARGYERAAVEAAADRIRDGDLVAPEEVARWRPAGG